MNILVLWSGGWDSTAILLQALAEGHNVTTLSIKFKNNQYQSEQELIATTNIYNHLIVRYNHFNMLRSTISVGFDKTPILSQPILWATSIATNVNDVIFDELRCGYIKTDVFWHIRENFEQIVLNGIKCCASTGDIKSFKYPFEWENKQYVYDYIKEYYPSIIKWIKTCECPIKTKNGFRRCGKCDKCKEFALINK